MKEIERVLTWAQVMQLSCLGTDVENKVSVQQGDDGSVITISVGVEGHFEDNGFFYFSEAMSNEDLFQAWGKAVDHTRNLLKKYSDVLINKHGRKIKKKRYGKNNKR